MVCASPSVSLLLSVFGFPRCFPLPLSHMQLTCCLVERRKMIQMNLLGLDFSRQAATMTPSLAYHCGVQRGASELDAASFTHILTA